MSDAEARSTRLFARALGPFLIAIGVMVLIRYETLYLLLPAFRQDLPLTLTAGGLISLVGFFLLAAHHHFKSPLSIGVSIICIIFLLRGLSLLLVPELVLDFATTVVRAPTILLFFCAFVLIAGAWLTVVGWFAQKV